MGAAALTSDPATLDELVERLRESVAPDLYAPGDFVPRESAEERLAALDEELALLQEVVDAGARSEHLAHALRQRPRIVEVLKLLFVAPNGAGFADGRELPEHPTNDPTVLDGLSSLAVELGLGWLAPPGADVGHLARVGLVAVDARRRGYRRRNSIEDRLTKLIDAAIDEVRISQGVDVQLLEPASYPAAARGRVRAMIGIDGVPVAGVATVLQAQSGGRQQRDLAVTYPQLQADLDAIPCSLLLIADGRGVAEAGPRTLRTLIGSVAACLTIKQVEQGELVDALSSAVVNRGARLSNDGGLDSLIDARLRTDAAVDTSTLPVPNATATLAVARYAAAHPDLALRLTDTGVQWSDPGHVTQAQELTQEFDPSAATVLLAELLALTDVRTIGSEDAPVRLHALIGRAPLDQVLPPALVLGATAERTDEQLARAFARLARRASAEASVALLVSDGTRAWRTTATARMLQRSLATSVVVIEPEELIAVAGAWSPRDAVVRIVLEQADLTKANPFNTTGATPRQMYFGREEEEGRLRGLLISNSAALIGGRRIGKTSLLQASVERLTEEGWSPFYADCQEAGDWTTFAAHVGPRWGVELEEHYRPALLANLVTQLQAKTDKPLVMALDEVDALLEWDLRPSHGQVAESFFRACRALSQERSAQFVFSGERLLAQRLWDASSPHWNFCVPVPVKQLDRPAADELITRPISALGVGVAERTAFLQLCWERTNGHPQVQQFLGDQLVRRLNDRNPTERFELAPADVRAVTETDSFRRHYLETYWGQATQLEQTLTALVVSGSASVDGLRRRLGELGIEAGGRDLQVALKMLELYGIIEEVEEGLQLRARWIGEAMRAFGGTRAVIDDGRPASAIVAGTTPPALDAEQIDDQALS